MVFEQFILKHPFFSVYYKGLSKQLFNVKFDLSQQQKNYVGGGSSGGLFDLENKTSNAAAVDSNDFVSAVCWRKQSNIIIAGNSRGIIKIMELV